ncbi:MAG: putative thiosulfate sulfurtransferase [Sphingomonadales bacterium]|nr:putative thiosulfate sulfurtransferase [Sphingomonadales bacterium]
MTDKIIDAKLFREWLEDGKELAVLDVRSVEDFAKGEPLYATNVPADTVLNDINAYVPRKQVRTVLVDNGDTRALELAKRLAELGRDQVFVLSGGVAAWLASGSGLPTFDTSGKIFSLAIQSELGTPVITVEQLQQKRDAGEDVIVIDTRTAPEFARGHVPGAVGIPAAELLRYFADAVPSSDTQVIVSCAGLPRAILGAQTLIDAGVANNVAYLDDGTAAWRRAGWALESGQGKTFEISESGGGEGRRLADRFSKVESVRQIDLATAREWAKAPLRTTYLLDVRLPDDFLRNHLPDTISAEGGQLLAVSHRTLAVRGARVVLIDDLDGIRADTVAHWLARRGFELAIVRHNFGEQDEAVAAHPVLATVA